MPPTHTNCPRLQHTPEPILTEPNCRCRKLRAYAGNFLVTEGDVCLFAEKWRPFHMRECPHAFSTPERTEINTHFFPVSR